MKKTMLLTTLLQYNLTTPMMITVEEDKYGFISKFDELEAEGIGDTEQDSIVALMENIEKIFIDIWKSPQQMNASNITKKAKINKILKNKC